MRESNLKTRNFEKYLGKTGIWLLIFITTWEGLAHSNLFSYVGEEDVRMTVLASSELYEEKLNQKAWILDQRADNVSRHLDILNESLSFKGEVRWGKLQTKG